MQINPHLRNSFLWHFFKLSFFSAIDSHSSIWIVGLALWNKMKKTKENFHYFNLFWRCRGFWNFFLFVPLGFLPSGVGFIFFMRKTWILLRTLECEWIWQEVSFWGSRKITHNSICYLKLKWWITFFCVVNPGDILPIEAMFQTASREGEMMFCRKK